MQGTASPQYSMCFGKGRQPSGWHPKASFPGRGKGTGGGSQTGRSLQWGKDWRENLLRFSLRPKWSFWTFTLSRQNLKFCLGALFFRIPNRSFVGLCPTTPVAFLKKSNAKNFTYSASSALGASFPYPNREATATIAENSSAFKEEPPIKPPSMSGSLSSSSQFFGFMEPP